MKKLEIIPASKFPLYTSAGLLYYIGKASSYIEGVQSAAESAGVTISSDSELGLYIAELEAWLVTAKAYRTKEWERKMGG